MKTPIDAGIIARAIGALGAAKNAWFGPSEPMAPLVTNPEQIESVRGRQFDFPVAINRNITPRSTEAVSFGMLRALADACDIARLVIETRKDQMSKLKWSIKPVKDGAVLDSRCDEVTNFFRFPDREHDWDTWLRMLIEEVLVTDAAAVYVRKTLGGGVYALEPMDGATIRRILDVHGRTPRAPDPAYQQILKGIPAIDYTTDELIYRPRNQRVWKVYGYSPMEQIIMTVNTALRRSSHVMQYYTEGNIPEALIGVPETWTMEQIKQFQTYWDSIMEGDTAARRHAHFVPGQLKIQNTKDSVLTDKFDEWLARVVCFAFSISPTPFVQQVNRATADSAQEAALEEGLAPIQQWVINLMNSIIHNHFGYMDLCFDWNDEESQDPKTAAEVNKIYIDACVLDPDEVRADLGYKPFTPEQKAAMAERKAAAQPFGFGGAPPPAPGDPTNENSDDEAEPNVDDEAEPNVDDEVKEAIAKAKKRQPGRINPDRATVVKLERKLGKAIHSFFVGQVGKIGKADTKLTVSVDWDELVPEITPIIASIASAGGMSALQQIGMNDADVEFGPRVTAWAQDRAAELVGRKWVDGELVDNPNAEWVISDSTRDMIQALTASATDEGLTMDEFAESLTDSFAFSEERASMIARTETRLADSAGQMEAYESSGVVEGTEWSTSNDDQVSEVCLSNEAAGVVPLGELYPSGDAAPPGHPNCRCCLVASLLPETE